MKRWMALVGFALGAVLVLVLWPAPDPLWQASSVALDFGETPTDPAGQAWITAGLALSLETRTGRRITVGTDPTQADCLLVVRSIRLHQGQLRWEDQGLWGKAEATCQVVEVASGRKVTYDLVLELRNGELRATLRPRKFWEFWKPR